MDIEIKRREIDCYSLTFEYAETLEAAAESVVPDVMPDAGRILGASGTLVIREKEVQQGSVSISAGVAATAVYAPEEGGGICCVSAAVPISLTVEAPGVTEDSVPVASMELLRVDARLLNPRKLLIRASVLLRLRCYDRNKLLLSRPPEPDGDACIRSRLSQTRISPVVCVREKTFVVTDEYRLLGVSELLRHNVALDAGDVRAVGTKLVFHGTATVNALYRDTEGQVMSASFITEYSQMLDADAELNAPDCRIHQLLTAEFIEPSALPGGDRGISCELHIVAQAVCSESMDAEFLSDCYCNKRELCVTSEPLMLRRIERRETLRCSVREMLEPECVAGAVIQTLCRTGEASLDDGAVNLPLIFCVIYTDKDGVCRSAEKRVSASLPLAIPKDCCTELGAEVLRDVFAAVAGGGIELRATAELEVLVTACVSAEQICALDCGDAADSAPWPSVTILRYDCSESLWSLAKRCHSAPELIDAANELCGAEPEAGCMLLIPAEK